MDRTADLEKYNDVQNLWEEYMAQTIADYLSSWEGKDKKFLAFAGNGHIIYDFGIPEKVFRRSHLPITQFIRLSFMETNLHQNMTFFTGNSFRTG